MAESVAAIYALNEHPTMRSTPASFRHMTQTRRRFSTFVGHVSKVFDNIYKLSLNFFSLSFFRQSWCLPRVYSYPIYHVKSHTWPTPTGRCAPEGCKKESVRGLFSERCWVQILTATSLVSDPLMHHGRHFGRAIYSFCNIKTLITNSLSRLADDEDIDELTMK